MGKPQPGIYQKRTAKNVSHSQSKRTEKLGDTYGIRRLSAVEAEIQSRIQQTERWETMTIGIHPPSSAQSLSRTKT